MKRWLTRMLSLIIVLVAMAAGWGYLQMKDRFPGYQVDLDLTPPEGIVEMKVGFAAMPITPEEWETWQDVDGDATFNPKKGDTFQDLNGNGKLDAPYIAGFHANRPATGIHDDLWVRVMVLDDGKNRMAIASLDLIGLGSDDVIYIRMLIPESLEIDYTTVMATHTHQGPDVLGMWGPNPYQTGLDEYYMSFVRTQTALAIIQAAQRMRPARLMYAEDLTGAAGLVGDSRPPEVKDPGIRIIQAIDAQTDTTLGTLACWANHPETLWSGNTEISSDFPHYYREAMEQGVGNLSGTGGICVYVNGAIGGLMTTDTTLSVRHPITGTVYRTPSFGKAEAQGKQLAMLSLKALRRAEPIPPAGLRIVAKTVELPLENQLFMLGAYMGVLQRGMPSWLTVRSEVAAWRIGPLSCIQVPGEIYPELVNGGVESPAGGDFSTIEIETQPLRTQMPGEHKLVFGLANDMIGYIIPQGQWDVEPPFTYDQAGAPYGEINSLGPHTAPKLMNAAKEVIERL
ncbi:hypothetical protein [Pontibacter sp. G13]|uniref:hypothetical protein n=1 Tax=Pontibacter sp. G13 TaxID=3074898 RepID=UPI00288B340E|nr:hypothetical protein [Pontibacter sp. G13]WNJ21012.1 hypothetical protein RJD25_11120 [Pontibacter sp. G13]